MTDKETNLTPLEREISEFEKQFAKGGYFMTPEQFSCVLSFMESAFTAGERAGRASLEPK